MKRNGKSEFCPRITRMDANSCFNSFSYSRHSRDSRADSGGFSLIEVMVAVSLLAVIIVGLLAMFYQTQRAFRSGIAQVDVLEGGRATLDMSARELQEMAAAFDPVITNLTLANRFAGLQVLMPNGTETINTLLQDVSFVRKVNDEWVGESYRVLNTNGNIGIGTLARAVTNAHWTRVEQLSADLAKIPDSAFLDPVTGQIRDRMADGIVHFRILPYDENGLLITNSVPPNIFFDRTTGYAFVSNALPAAIELEIAIVEPRVLEQFNARASVNPQNALVYLSGQAGRIHFLKQRIPIRNAQRLAVNTP